MKIFADNTFCYSIIRLTYTRHLVVTYYMFHVRCLDSLRFEVILNIDNYWYKSYLLIHHCHA